MLSSIPTVKVIQLNFTKSFKAQVRTLKRLCMFIFKKWVCLSFLTKWNVHFVYCHSFDRMCTVCIYLWPYSYSNVPLFNVPYHISCIIDFKTVVIQRLVWKLLGIDIGADSCSIYDLYFFFMLHFKPWNIVRQLSNYSY